MFDQLFVRPHALARQRAGPLAEERRRFLLLLADQGMARKTLRQAAYYLLVVADSLRLAERTGEVIGDAEVEQHAARWADRPPGPHEGIGRRRSRADFRWHATRWLHFLGRLRRTPAPTGPCADLIAEFADFMRRERGLSPATIRSRCWVVRTFLGRLGIADDSLFELTCTRIDQAFSEAIARGGYTRSTVRTHAHSLRAFFRHAEARGRCRPGLAVAISSPRVFP